MKNILKTFTLFIFMFSLSQIAFGQGEIIEEAEVTKLIVNSNKLREGKSYRKVELIKNYNEEGSTLTSQYNNMTEVLPPDKKYSSHEYQKGEDKGKTEFITIGNKEFIRKNEGVWEIYSPKYGDGFGIGEQRETRVTRYLGTEKLGEKNTKVYEITSNTKSDHGNPLTKLYKYWYDQNGFLLKRTIIFFNAKNKDTFSNVTTYDFDAEIKIAAPKLEETKQTKVKTRVVNERNDKSPIIKLMGSNKLPFQAIIYISADDDTKYGEVIEAIKLGRKSDVDDFGLLLNNQNVEDSIDVKIPAEPIDEEIPTVIETIKLNPLLLIVAYDNDGNITINNEKQTEQSLVSNLRKIFKTRTKQKVFREGTDQIEKTLFIKATLSAKYLDVLKIIKLVKRAGANPVALQVDDLLN